MLAFASILCKAWGSLLAVKDSLRRPSVVLDRHPLNKIHIHVLQNVIACKCFCDYGIETMISKMMLLTLAFLLGSTGVDAAELDETRMENQSSAVLPPLPDLPIPGSHAKVSGNKDIQAVTRKNSDGKSEKKNAATATEPSTDVPSPLVFGNGSTGQIVF